MGCVGQRSPPLDAFMYEMVADIDVLNLGVVLCILGERDSPVVVVVQDHWLWLEKTNLVHP